MALVAKKLAAQLSRWKSNAADQRAEVEAALIDWARCRSEGGDTDIDDAMAVKLETVISDATHQSAALSAAIAALPL
ncbi:hypothetical protein AS156_31475 [Bradyrhizobium macuxiense]|uniref:Uncharacterized protein n=1 Tax=Bradyrhizobium macuxiense TaxID=1755647 RepID=A0A109K291_9BRAD|nr:hypothetical protein [Bradyrhizobium macuxiense]KWV59341.1 hypothetical protein AS156_31475 [Bradyrhizobium macuxiense]